MPCELALASMWQAGQGPWLLCLVCASGVEIARLQRNKVVGRYDTILQGTVEIAQRASEVVDVATYLKAIW